MQIIKKISIVVAVGMLLFSSCARKSSYGCPFSAEQTKKVVEVKKSI